MNWVQKPVSAMAIIIKATLEKGSHVTVSILKKAADVKKVAVKENKELRNGNVRHAAERF